MKSLALMSCILIGVLSSSFSQGYFNKIIEFPDKSPNPITLELDDEDYVIGSINLIDFVSSTSIVTVDKGSFETNIFDFKGFKLGRNGLFVENSENYSFGDNFIDNSKLSVNAYNKNWEVENTYDYEPHHGRRAALGSNLIDGFIYGPSRDEDEALDLEEVTLKKIALDGSEVWSRNFGLNDDDTFTYEIEPSADQNLLMTTLIEPPNVFGRQNKIYKISTDGNLQWTYRTIESPWIGTGCWISTLSNGEILISRSVDYSQNFNHLLSGYYPYPPQFIWLNDTGQPIRDSTILSVTQHELLIFGHTSSEEGYTIGYGVSEPTGGSLQKGWLFKMDNEGEILWFKTYLHPQFADRDHRITDIEIMENGDILCLGGISEAGEKSEIWLFKVNENGCFGDDQCEDDLIYTYTDDYSLQNKIYIYPNPTSGIIFFNDISDFKSYSIIDVHGKILLKSKEISESVDLSFLDDGLYIISLLTKNGGNTVAKVILSK